MQRSRVADEDQEELANVFGAMNLQAARPGGKRRVSMFEIARFLNLHLAPKP